MAERKNSADFTVTVVPEVPSAAKQTTSKSLPNPARPDGRGKTAWNVKLAKAQEELEFAKAQLAAANDAINNLQNAMATQTVPSRNKPSRPPLSSVHHVSVLPTTTTNANNIANTGGEEGEDLEFHVDIPTPTHPSAVKEVVKKTKAKPKAVKIVLDGDRTKLNAKPVNAGNQLVNPAALACGDYLHGEMEPSDMDEDAEEGLDNVATFMHQGVVFDLSAYTSAAIAPVPRRCAAFAIDALITTVISFVLMTSAQARFWMNFAKDLYQAFLNWLDGPIFNLGFVIETLAQGQLNQLSFHFDVFANVFSVYLPLLDLKSVIIVAIIWAATTTVALGFWDSTLGQKILHLKIIHMHREHLGWPWALLRQVIYLPLSIISVIGILMGLTGSRRCWHDYLSGCKVTYY